MHKDVQGQLGHEEAPPHPRAPGARVCGVRQGLCGELQAKTAPTGTHRGEAFPGKPSVRGPLIPRPRRVIHPAFTASGEFSHPRLDYYSRI